MSDSRLYYLNVNFSNLPAPIIEKFGVFHRSVEFNSLIEFGRQIFNKMLELASYLGDTSGINMYPNTKRSASGRIISNIDPKSIRINTLPLSSLPAVDLDTMRTAYGRMPVSLPYYCDVVFVEKETGLEINGTIEWRNEKDEFEKKLFTLLDKSLGIGSHWWNIQEAVKIDRIEPGPKPDGMKLEELPVATTDITTYRDETSIAWFLANALPLFNRKLYLSRSRTVDEWRTAADNRCKDSALLATWEKYERFVRLVEEGHRSVVANSTYRVLQAQAKAKLEEIKRKAAEEFGADIDQLLKDAEEEYNESCKEERAAAANTDTGMDESDRYMQVLLKKTAALHQASKPVFYRASIVHSFPVAKACNMDTSPAGCSRGGCPWICGIYRTRAATHGIYGTRAAIRGICGTRAATRGSRGSWSVAPIVVRRRCTVCDIYSARH